MFLLFWASLEYYSKTIIIDRPSFVLYSTSVRFELAKSPKVLGDPVRLSGL